MILKSEEKKLFNYCKYLCLANIFRFYSVLDLQGPLRALLKSGLSATQLCIRSDTASLSLAVPGHDEISQVKNIEKSECF